MLQFASGCVYMEDSDPSHPALTKTSMYHSTDFTNNVTVYSHSEWEVYSAYHLTQPLKYSFLEELLSSIAYNWKTGGISLADVRFLRLNYVLICIIEHLSVSLVVNFN